jgi:dynactin complex subunit
MRDHETHRTWIEKGWNRNSTDSDFQTDLGLYKLVLNCTTLNAKNSKKLHENIFFLYNKLKRVSLLRYKTKANNKTENCIHR